MCKACGQWIGREEPGELLECNENHIEHGEANHEGSSDKMEVDGVIEMFQRFVEYFKVKYSKNVGDGDSKTSKNLLDADPYNGNLVVEEKKVHLAHQKNV